MTKKRIGLTQRAHAIAGYGERRDMLDQRWATLIEDLGACPIPLANGIRDIPAYLDAIPLDALLMTGGNDIGGQDGAADIAPERDRLEAAAYAHCKAAGIAVLGVCRGAQMINVLEGGRLVRRQGHVGKRHGLHWSKHAPAGWYRPDEVNSFHGWVIPEDGLAPPLHGDAHADDGSIEAFHHREASVIGMLWHPEREATLAREMADFLRHILHI